MMTHLKQKLGSSIENEFNPDPSKKAQKVIFSRKIKNETT